MNERIRQLAEQAGYTEAYYDGDYGPFVPEEFNKEKFAELMVKKFDDILLLEWLDCIANDDKKSVLLLDRIRDKTKTYFGVEE